MNIPVHRSAVPSHLSSNKTPSAMRDPVKAALMDIGNAEIEYRIRRKAIADYHSAAGSFIDDSQREQREALVRAGVLAWEDVKAARARYEAALEDFINDLDIPF